MKPLSTNMDKTAIALSLACAVHCLLFPVALVMLPAYLSSTLGDERFHLWMLAAVIPISLIALRLGCQQHRNTGVMIPGLIGLALLTLTALLGHNFLGETGEKIASLVGASLIAFSHFRNHALCKRLSCDCNAG
ncbi:MAG: MerC domain-containing protein [Immundisolibacteraceae bacterium]|nr:MerC domain-containing protein [Immundisolibacteraceae bacterium]